LEKVDWQLTPENINTTLLLLTQYCRALVNELTKEERASLKTVQKSYKSLLFQEPETMIADEQLLIDTINETMSSSQFRAGLSHADSHQKNAFIHAVVGLYEHRMGNVAKDV
jgi:uncharacterized protein (DUF488 family)